MSENKFRKTAEEKGIALIYFFFNTVALPAPISYTSLLGLLKFPQLIKKYGKVLLVIGGVLAIYAVIHNVQGVVYLDYFKSTAFYIVLLISGFAAYEYISSMRGKLEDILKLVSLVAIGMLAIGVALWFTPLSNWLWSDHKFIGDGAMLRRFQGLAYEPSHFALVLSPVILYFFWKTVYRLRWKNILYFLATIIPVALTISFGFFVGFAVALALTLLTVLIVYQKFKRVLLVPVILAVIGCVAILQFQNPISNRIHHIAEGKDTSVNGRTTEAFMLAHQCAEKRNVWFGIGMGQIKYIGEEVIRPFYQELDPEGYSKEGWPVLRIPNSLAETLAIYGYSGVILKIGLVVFLFFRFRVYDNYFNLSVFLFIFCYQLMGSFILSSTEIIMWALAFSKVFDEFKILNPRSETQ